MVGIVFPLTSAKVTIIPLKFAVPAPTTLNTSTANCTVLETALHAPPNVTTPLVSALD